MSAWDVKYAESSTDCRDENLATTRVRSALRLFSAGPAGVLPVPRSLHSSKRHFRRSGISESQYAASERGGDKWSGPQPSGYAA